MSQTLRLYQSGALDACRASIAAGRRKILLVAPTGAGKTTIAAAMIHGAVARGGSVVFLAHRSELISQCSERLDGVGVDHGVIQGGHPRDLPGLPVQVASVQTLVRREELPRATVLVVDEAHRARAATYGKILDRYPEAVVIGLTATPWRNDGRGLGELFEDLVLAARPRELVDQGFLVPYTGFAYDHPDTAVVERRGADFDGHGLEMVMGSRKLVGNIVQQYLEHAPGQLAVVFAVSVAHSIALRDRFLEAGVAAAHLDGDTPAGERTETLRRMARGEIRVLCNVNLVTEGWDLPALRLCILARPTLSTTLYLQMVGRVLRPADGKTVARIHDHAGCFLEHGAPDLDRDYSLTADLRTKAGKKEKLPPIRTCEECLRIYDPTLSDSCPSCGHQNLAASRAPKELDDEKVRRIPLSELPQFAGATESQKRGAYEKWLADALAAGKKPGMAAHKYKAVYGHWPPRSWSQGAA